MCKECGCESLKKNVRLQFCVSGYTEEKVRAVERRLLGLRGVFYVHIHALEGMTEIDYSPAKTRLSEILGVFAASGLQAEL